MSRQKNHPMKLPMRESLSPSSREAHCCLCSEYISNAYDRRKLWQSVDRKSRICTLVEQVLQVNIIKSVHTEVICRDCFTKVKSLDIKIQSARDEIDTYVRQIGQHGAAMKCMKRDIRERITATKTAKQCRNRNSADCPVDRSFSDNSVQPSLPESPPGDRYQQSAIVSAPWMSSLLPGTGLQLGSSQPAQSVSPTPSASTPGGSGRSTPSTQPYGGESASQTSHIGDGSSNGDHEACDTATGERNEPGSPDATQHTDDQTSVSHNEVIISLLRRTDGVTKAAQEDSVLNDVSKVDSADCTEETFRTCDWGTNSDLEAGHGNVVKMEKSDTLYPDVDEMNGNMVKSEEGDSHYVDVVKSEGDISQYIDAQLSAGSQRKVTTPSRRQRKPKRLWKCNSCWTVCLSRSALKIHDRIHTGVKPYTCDTCGRSFAQTSCLKTHSRTHTGEKPFMCTSCGKSYGASSELKIHERTHRGEKPYLCATCGKSFVSSSNLRQHETTHVLVRMYMCPTCDKSFVSYSHLTRHRKIHSGVRPHICAVCGRAFVRACHLSRHEKSLHGPKV